MLFLISEQQRTILEIENAEQKGEWSSRRVIIVPFKF